jgi:hypothetical protein
MKNFNTISEDLHVKLNHEITNYKSLTFGNKLIKDSTKTLIGSIDYERFNSSVNILIVLIIFNDFILQI